MSDQQDILKLLARRIVEATQSDKDQNLPQFSDGKKIALGLKGGGMRGVIEAATAAAFESTARLAELIPENNGDCLAARKQLHAEHADYAKTKQYSTSGASWCDEMFCVSVGAPVGLFFAAKQARLRTPIFFEEMATPKFLNLALILGIAKREITDRNHDKDFRPPMDLGLMMRAIKAPEKGLNIAEVQKSGIPIRFAVTDLNAPIQSRWIDPMAQGNDVLELTKAACRIPGIAGKPEEGEPRYVDAMVSPLTMMPTDEFDHIVVFDSHPVNAKPDNKRFDIADQVTTWVSRAAMNDKDEAKEYLKFIDSQKQRSAQVEEESKKHPDRFVYFGTPEGSEEITNATIDPEKLKKQADLAYRYTMERLYAPLIEVLIEKNVPIKNADAADFSPPTFWEIREASEQPNRTHSRRISQAFKQTKG